MTRPVTIVAAELHAVDLPFHKPFKHAAAERAASQSLFLKCVTDSGAIGFGECLPREYVTGETLEGAYALLCNLVLPRLVGLQFESMAATEAFLATCDGRAPATWVDASTPQGAAWCAVDLALLDTCGRAFDTQPLAEQSRTLPPNLRYSGVLSADRPMQTARAAIKQRLFGLRQIKIKVSREHPDRAVRLARLLCGRRTDLRVDMNMAWTRDEAKQRMKGLARHGIRSFEQPLAADDLDGMARLVSETGLEVMADESFTTRESLQRLIAHRSCTAVNARISKCGGLMATLARCREALAAGLDVQIGCQVGESSLLSSAQLILMGAAGRVKFAEGCFGRHLLRQDPAAPILQFGFRGQPPPRPNGAGLGVTINEETIERFQIRRERIDATGAKAA